MDSIKKREHIITKKQKRESTLYQKNRENTANTKRDINLNKKKSKIRDINKSRHYFIFDKKLLSL